MTVPIRKRYVTSAFGQLHLREGGIGTDHVPVLLLHQNPSSSFEYEPLIRALATDRQVIAFDTPGYGMSDAPPSPLGLAEYVSVMADCLTEAGLPPEQPFDLYGFHTGSLLALEMALARPAQARRVAVTGIPMRSGEERAALLDKARKAPALDEEGKVALDMARALWDYVVGGRDKRVPLARSAALWMEKFRALDRSAWAYHGVWSYDYARLPKVRQPVLLVQPEEPISAVSIAAARMIPAHTILEMPDVRRDVFDLPEAVDRIALALRSFFDQPSRQEQ